MVFRLASFLEKTRQALFVGFCPRKNRFFGKIVGGTSKVHALASSFCKSEITTFSGSAVLVA